MDEEWIRLIGEAKQQGLSKKDVRNHLRNQSDGTKFYYEKDESGMLKRRVLEVTDVDHQMVIHMAVRHYNQYYVNKGWDKDEEMARFYTNIKTVNHVLDGINRPEEPEIRRNP